MSTGPAPHEKLRPLMKNGAMTMLALDQRGSLRTILANGRDEREISDARLIDFKATAAQILSPLASAVLLDSGLGREAMRRIAPGVPLILSADCFEQSAGGPVETSDVDPAVTPALIEACGATALKQLVIWREGSGVEFRRDVVGRFVALARRTGRIALVEGLVRDRKGARFATVQEHGEAVIEAARELVEPGPDVYKAEVPGYLPGQLGEVPTYARRLTQAIGQPWVVLSNGVTAEDFPKAVELCCRGGASGFLAGRAIWADAAAKSDPRREIERESLPRLQRLIEIVATARGAQ